MDFDGICMNCFSHLTHGSVCDKCGYDNDNENEIPFLPQKSILFGKYAVGREIKRDSDSVTYNGYDIESKARVTIREFLPLEIASRLEGTSEVHIREKFKKSFENYKKSFLKLWKAMSSLSNLSAVIPVIDVFSENGTAYTIFKYEKSMSLRDFLLKQPENRIKWDQAQIMFMPILTTIESLHKAGIIHGGIDPDNLLLCADGKVKLAGFCISECNHADTELKFNDHAGYTALEQYANDHKISPATDIYSFSACIYRALVGTNPPGALSREVNDKLMIPNSIAEQIPAYVIKALGVGLQIYPEQRVQTISDFRQFLSASPAVKEGAVNELPDPVRHSEKTEQQDNQKAKEPKKKNKKKNGSAAKIIIIILVALIVIAGIYLIGVRDILSLRETTTAQTTEQMIQVPNFAGVGYSREDIEDAAAWNSQFKITYNEEYSDTAAKGTIFKQSVKAGSSVPKGTAITLTVSKGVEMATVPDVSGMNEDSAIKELEQAGFKVKTVKVYNDGSYTPADVKDDGITPEAGQSVKKGSQVILQIYGDVETTTQPTTTEPETEADTQSTTEQENQ